MRAQRLTRRVLASFILLGLFGPLIAWAQPLPNLDTLRVLDSIRTVRKQKIHDFTNSRYPIGWRIDTLTNIPTELRGENLSKGLTQTDPVEAAYKFFELHKEIFGMTNPRLELKVLRAPKSQYGAMVDFQQLYMGIPLPGGGARAHFSKEGKLKEITTTFLPETDILVDVSTVPSIDSLSAIEIAKLELNYTEENEKLAWEYIEGMRNKNLRPFSASLELILFEGKYHLSWVVSIFRFQPDDSWLYFIDAHRGVVLFRKDQIHREPRRPSTGTPNKTGKLLSKPRSKAEEEFPFPPKIETVQVKTEPQPVPELYQKIQDSIKKLEQKGLEDEARRHNMSPAEFKRYLDDLEKQKALESAPVPYFKRQQAPAQNQKNDAPVEPAVFDTLMPPRVIDPGMVPESLKKSMEQIIQEYNQQTKKRLRKPNEQKKDSSDSFSAAGAVVPTAWLDDAWWGGIPRDCNLNGYYSLTQLVWNPDLLVCGTGEQLVVYEKIYFRRPGGNWTALQNYTPTAHTIVDCYTSDIQSIYILGGGRDYYDFRIEIYRADQPTYDDFLDPDYDYDLDNYPMETTSEDLCFRAKIHNAWWEHTADCNGNSYYSSATLKWDPDVIGCLGDLSVREKISYRPAGSSQSWTEYATTSTHTIIGCTSFDDDSVIVQSLLPGCYEWKIEIFRTGQGLPDTSATPQTDGDLAFLCMETAVQDACPGVNIADAWWTNTIDCDRDGYVSAGRLNWNPNVGGCGGPVRVFERISYKRHDVGAYALLLQTSVRSISGCDNSDAQSLIVPQLDSAKYDWKIEIFREGQNFPDHARDPGNDPSDLNDYKMETVSQDPCTPFATIQEAWWSNEVDCDGDGYKSSVRLNWNSDVLDCGGQISVFEQVWRKPSGGSWTFAGSTPTHTISGCATSDAQFKDYIGPGSSQSLQDWKIEIFREFQTIPDYVRDSSNDLDLESYWMESTFLDPCLQPDLVCYKPIDWDSAIVVSNQPWTNSQSQPTHTKPAYIDFCLANQGLGRAGASTTSKVYVDGVWVKDVVFPPLNAGYLNTAIDIPYTFNSTGTHWVKIEHDATNAVPETNETNNVCSLKVIVKCLAGYPPGIGVGVMGDTIDHIDTDTLFDTTYILWDRTRESDINPHFHNGQMQFLSGIETQKWRPNAQPVGIYDPQNVWNDPEQASAVGAHVYTGWTYDYLLNVLGRNSHDSVGGRMHCVVEDFSDTNNAGYINNLNRLTVYIASGSDNRSFAGALDAIAHEWGHGVMNFASKLFHERESGALLEAFGDWLGVSVGFKFNDPDWEFAENTDSAFRPLRNLANPPALGHPDTYKGTNWFNVETCTTPSEANDFCEIHKNAGVINKMFYLFANGGSHNGITVNGIPIDSAMKVMNWANNDKWDTTTTFPQAMRGSLLAAIDLDQSPLKPWAKELLKAWEAVKVCRPNGDVNQDGGTFGSDVVMILTCAFLVGMEAGGCDRCNGDVNCDGLPTSSDVVGILNLANQRPYTSPCPQ